MDVLAQRFQPLADAVTKVLDPFRAVPKPAYPPLWEGDVGKFHLAFYPQQFYLQGALLALALLYALTAWVGRWRNRRIANQVAETYARALRTEFALVGAGDDHSLLVWNGAADAMLFASGRRGVEVLQATFQLAPRHDLLKRVGAFLYDHLWLPSTPVQVHDRVALSFRLPHDEKRTLGTFALIDKHALQRVRQNRFDLLFAKVADAENANTQRALDERFAIASEHGELTDRFLGEVGVRGDEQRKRLGLVEAVNGPAGRFLESLVVTDQPETRPASASTPNMDRVVLTLRVPRSVRDAEATFPLLAAALDIIDALYLASTGRSTLLALRPETQNSLKKTRIEVAKALEEQAALYADADEQEEREEARRKAQQEKFEKLTPAEQAKRKQIEKKRAQRKQQQSQTVRRR